MNQISSFAKRHVPELILAAAFLILALVGISHHELWVDEARPWIISRTTEWSALTHTAKLESHPVLWYALIKIATGITDNPVLLQLMSVAFGFIAFLTILFYSPFTRIEKLLLTTNLYLFFEYTVVARNYSLEMAALFILCALFANRRQHLAWYFLVCGVLAQSHFYGFLWSLLFILLLYFSDRPRFAEFKKSTWAAAGFYLLCAGATAWVVVRDPEQITLVHSLDHLSSLKALAIAKTLLLGLFPAVYPEDIYVNPTSATSWFDMYAAILLVAALGHIIYLLRKNRTALLVFVSMLSVFIGFSVMRQYESLPPRHMGQMILILLVTLWIGKDSLKSRTLRSVLFVVFATQAFAGLYMFAKDFRHPFSNGRDMANWLRQTDLPKSDIVADGPFYSAGFLAYMDDTSIYNAITGERMHFWRINKENMRHIKVRPGVDGVPVIHTREEALSKLIKDIRCAKKEPLFITNYPADFFKWPEIQMELIKSFTGAMRAKEDFYVYRITGDLGRLCGTSI